MINVFCLRCYSWNFLILLWTTRLNLINAKSIHILLGSCCLNVASSLKRLNYVEHVASINQPIHWHLDDGLTLNTKTHHDAFWLLNISCELFWRVFCLRPSKLVLLWFHYEWWHNFGDRKKNNESIFHFSGIRFSTRSEKDF